MCYSATSDHLGLQMLCRAFGDARCKIPGNHWLLLVMENSCKRLAAIILHFALGGQAIPRDHVHCLAATATRERVRKRAKLKLFTGERDATSARYYAVTCRER
jgi:hypothetical protein